MFSDENRLKNRFWDPETWTMIFLTVGDWKVLQIMTGSLPQWTTYHPVKKKEWMMHQPDDKSFAHGFDLFYFLFFYLIFFINTCFYIFH